MKSFAVAVVLVGLAVGLYAAEKPVNFSDLPAAAQQTVKQHASLDQIKKIDQEEEDGKLVYDVEFTKAGKHGELDVDADGKLVSVEEEITEKDLPDAVRKTLREHGGQVGTLMKVTEKGQTHYEAIVTKDGKKSELEIAADGKVTKTEEASDKKD